MKRKNLEELQAVVIEFRDERNWGKFHNPKDLAISLSLEASELLENFQWKTSEEVVEKKMEELKEELADVYIYALLLSHELGIDIEKTIMEKIEKNKGKYPVKKAYGSNQKYTEFK